jgi:hypothetical protein
LPELDELMTQAAAVLQTCEQAVRDGRPPRNVRPLRPAQEQVALALSVRPVVIGDVQTAGAIMDATDRIANSIDTLVSELRRQL